MVLISRRLTTDPCETMRLSKFLFGLLDLESRGKRDPGIEQAVKKSKSFLTSLEPGSFVGFEFLVL